ncbi:hypothetical protein BKA70DRAFT_710697 [Coprinopsis sp. MPI-PUGE-AT-0042]|nr:hypothetical protein BKA70DRAFT_710697 [Coprinopsis sp. MPI-PUGE-AT-0042]
MGQFLEQLDRKGACIGCSPTLLCLTLFPVSYSAGFVPSLHDGSIWTSICFRGVKSGMGQTESVLGALRWSRRVLPPTTAQPSMPRGIRGHLIWLNGISSTPSTSVFPCLFSLRRRPAGAYFSCYSCLSLSQEVSIGRVCGEDSKNNQSRRGPLRGVFLRFDYELLKLTPTTTKLSSN